MAGTWDRPPTALLAFPMSKLTKWLVPVRQLAAAFFRHDVSLKQERGQLRVVLEERKVPLPARFERAESERRRRHEEVMLVRTELAALLNELPETRLTMRHLVFVEQALAKKGLRVLHKVPLPVLQRAHEQLENLVINWSAAGLANLRSKMAVAIIDREHMDPHAEADAYRTAAVLDNDATEADLQELPMPPHSEALSGSMPSDDDAALAAAYAALGDMAPTTMNGTFDNQAALHEPVAVQFQGELGSASARALRAPASRSFEEDTPEISIRVLQP